MMQRWQKLQTERVCSMNIIKIDKNNLVNGAGCRCVVWTAGCCHNCKNCHNPETHDPNVGSPINADHINQILAQLGDDNVDGITITGGDPMMPYNHVDLLSLVKQCKTKFPNKSIWIWSGYTWEVLKDNDIMKYVDVLIDGKFVEELKPKRKNLRYRGSLNQRVIDVKKSLAADKVVYWEDFDGWTSNKDRVRSLGEALTNYKASCDQ